MDYDVARYRRRYTRQELIDLIKRRVDELEDSNLESIANELECGDFAYEDNTFIENPYGDDVNKRNSFAEVKKGDSVLVVPALSNDFTHEFQATVVGYKRGNKESTLSKNPPEDIVVVVDQEDTAFDVEPDGLIKDE